MPADSSSPATPPPTTPNRWRRRAARLWWWMLPGMIATIVLLVASIAFNRTPSTRMRWDGEAPLSVLTALGWSPDGPIDRTKAPGGAAWIGYTINALRPVDGFVRERLIEFHAERPDISESQIGWGVTVAGCGFPVPWLMRCETGVIYTPETKTAPQIATFDYRWVLGLFPVLPEGDPHTLSVRRVSPFVYDYLTYYPDPLGFLLNTVIFSTLWMPITAWHRRRRAKRGGCKRCGYSREGLAESAVCPECGLRTGLDSKNVS